MVADSAERTRSRAVLRRALALLVGFALIPIVLEAGLWIGYALFHPAERAARAPEPGTRHILCIGDSHTYGSHLDAQESYPGQLQALLDRAAPQPWRVINLAYPGLNSAETRLRLARNIAVYEPEVVICLSGANTTWSEAEGHLWDHPHDEPPAQSGRRWWQSSRALGLVRMTLRRIELGFGGDREQMQLDRASRTLPTAGGVDRGGGVDSVESVFPAGSLGLAPEEFERRVRVDLERMRQICEERGARLVVANYPVALQTTRRTINVTLERFATETQTPFVDLAARIAPLGERFGFSVLWFNDHHCTAAGNHEVARTVLAGLIEADLLEDREVWREVEPLEERLRDPGLFVLSREGDRVEVKLQDRPGARFRIGLYAWLSQEGGDAEPWQVHLARAGLAPQDRKAFFGQLDASGWAQTSVQLPDPAGLANMGAPGGIEFPRGATLDHWQLIPHFMPDGGTLEDARARPGVDLAVEPGG